MGFDLRGQLARALNCGCATRWDETARTRRNEFAGGWLPGGVNGETLQ